MQQDILSLTITSENTFQLREDLFSFSFFFHFWFLLKFVVKNSASFCEDLFFWRSLPARNHCPPNFRLPTENSVLATCWELIKFLAFRLTLNVEFYIFKILKFRNLNFWIFKLLKFWKIKFWETWIFGNWNLKFLNFWILNLGNFEFW